MPMDTIADLARLGYGLRARCLPCERVVMLDLDALIRDGRGELDYVRAKMRCTECGEIGKMQLVPLSTLGGRSMYRMTVPT